MSALDLGPAWREVTRDEWQASDKPMTGDYAYVRLAEEDHYFFLVARLEEA